MLVGELLGGTVTALDPVTLDATPVLALPEVAPRGDRRLAHGEVRGVYDLAPRPASDEVWAAHLLLGTDTPQPALDFESTVFPAVSVLGPSLDREAVLATDAADVVGLDGAFGDVVSGPRAKLPLGFQKTPYLNQPPPLRALTEFSTSDSLQDFLRVLEGERAISSGG